MWLSGRRPPAMLMLIFVFWVLAPFGALVAARRAARRWPALTLSDAALDLLAASLSAGSLLVYGAVVLGPWRAHVVRAFVLVPPLSTLLVAVSVAALATRR